MLPTYAFTHLPVLSFQAVPIEANYAFPLSHQTCIFTREIFTCPRQWDLGFFLPGCTITYRLLLGRMNISVSRLQDLPMFYEFYSYEKSISRNNMVLPSERFPSLALSRTVIMLRHLSIQFSLYYLPIKWSRTRGENKRKFRTLGSESGCGRL